MNTAFLTTLAMIAFAANSILCRMALEGSAIDAGSFSLIRIISGALLLSLLIAVKTKNVRSPFKTISWKYPAALSVYAICFSYAYIALPATSGALILFTVVQITMMIALLIKGKKLSYMQWLAYCMCLLGFFILLLPSAEAPKALPAILMSLSGIAWGAYTLLSKNVTDPLHTVQKAFLWSVPLLAAFYIVVLLTNKTSLEISLEGIILAIASGALASGLGYFIWYEALRKLSTFNAAIAQLSVPIITALLGVIILNEAISLQTYVAAALIMLGLSVNAFTQK